MTRTRWPRAASHSHSSPVFLPVPMCSGAKLMPTTRIRLMRSVRDQYALRPKKPLATVIAMILMSNHSDQFCM
jgi:hypothetical protein